MPAFVASRVGEGVGEAVDNTVGVAAVIATQQRVGREGASGAVVIGSNLVAVDIETGGIGETCTHKDSGGGVIGRGSSTQLARCALHGTHVVFIGSGGGIGRIGSLCIHPQAGSGRLRGAEWVGHDHLQACVALGLSQGLHVLSRNFEVDGVAVGTKQHGAVVSLATDRDADAGARLGIGGTAHMEICNALGCVEHAICGQRVQANRRQCGVDDELVGAHIVFGNTTCLRADGHIVGVVGKRDPANHLCCI